MTPSTSLSIPSKWTSCNAEWQKKVSLLCLNTVAWYSEEAPSILWVYHSYAYQSLLALVALISRWIQNFRRTAGLTSNAFHDWSIEQSVSVPTFLGQLQTGCKWLRTKYTRIQLSTEWDCLFPWKFDRLCISKASGRDSKENRIFLQRN